MASFTERYHELTKYNPHTIDKLGPVRWDSQPPAFKSISSKDKVDLLSHLQVIMDDLDRPLETQKSEIGLEDIARLLFFTLGLTARLARQDSEDFFLRAAPSAGGLYPTEIYVAVRNQQSAPSTGPGLPDGDRPGLPDGLYHYHSLKSALIPVWQGAFWADLKHYFLGNPAVESSDLIFLFTGIYGRSAWRYKERAYRRILLDTGHAVGNLLEVCRHSGLDHALMGGFLDEGLEELLFLTPKEEFPLLGVAVGRSGVYSANPGQHPSAPPSEAVRHLSPEDPMQVQQNSCERIRASEKIRPPVSGTCGSPAVTPNPGENILKTILNRRSCRKFNSQSVSVEQLRENLAYAFRSEGSAWCLASGYLDFHLVALHVEDLESGIYTLVPATLELKPRQSGDFKSEAIFMCLGQDLASECAYALVHTANLAALAEAYGDRGYRYACMDAGQIGERINLSAVQQGLGSSGIGGYYDDQANELLGLPLSHGILYITLVGVPDG